MFFEAIKERLNEVEQLVMANKAVSENDAQRCRLLIHEALTLAADLQREAERQR
jgi:hypothetical protein